MTINLQTNLSQQLWDFPDLVLKKRFADALDAAVANFPIYRTIRFAASTGLEELFDAFALQLGLRGYRFETQQLLLEGPGLFATVHGSRKFEYCSCAFNVWSADLATNEAFRAKVDALVGERIVSAPMFSIDWHFLTSKGELQSAAIEEMADDKLSDLAYPEVTTGINQFVEEYLAATETVLVLQGPPGTGKTRLIRAILGAMSHRRHGRAHAMYTGDMRALETDEIFVKFITGWHDAFVVEDADHMLRPRAEGNEHLHRFLTIADGVVRSQGRKIIFSTNLPNIGDLDEALVRPGRCFAHLNIRELNLVEADAFLREVGQGNTNLPKAIHALSGPRERPTASIAELYGLLRRGHS
jgi:energy-coupling factor transporter ATP-binding protein EcfA2